MSQENNLKLQKVLAMYGVASRRVAEQMIREGRVYVNGIPAHIGMRVDEDDKIEVDGKKLHKPEEGQTPYF